MQQCSHEEGNPRARQASTPVLLTRWLERLGGRRTAYAIQRADGRYRCVHAPLTPTLLAAHLAGRLTLGHYVLDEQDCCCYAVVDADQLDGLQRLVALQQVLAAQGIPTSLEASRRGGHLWLWLAQPTPAIQVRAWLRPLCSPNLELYPKQDTASGYGSLIRLPLGVHRRSGRRYPFLVADGSQRLHPVGGNVYTQLSWWLEQPAAVLPAHLDSVAQTRPEARLPTPPVHAQASYSSPHARATLPARTSPILAWCLARDPLAVIGRYVLLDQHGRGRCPFGWHHHNGQDRHPSFKVFPHTPAGNCWYCYTWGRGGSLFDFFRLLWQVDARTAWQRLQHGGER
ncbi:MAG: hypothetical protein IRZ24_19060 [Thermogemmatispora sp.]|uniref:TOTE conflict system archaeo-eukaryotic primase domain-containing protein n=1 Tax=Thermogemmatispora sp. TaxID=1968838 RepID=UPI001DAF77D3|nr:hypothetical protein [Thermogemmatispora sp.]MBX5452171.1 hypothetical protein [Thermogemmatispora sp.]